MNWRLFINADGSTVFKVCHDQLRGGQGKDSQGPSVPSSVVKWNGRGLGDRLTCTEPSLVLNELLKDGWVSDGVEVRLWSRLQVCKSCTNLFGLSFSDHAEEKCTVVWEDAFWDAPKKKQYSVEKATLVLTAKEKISGD